MRFLGGAIGVLVLGACAVSEPEPPKVPLSRRAAIDFQCSARELNITSDDDRVWQVRGCNKFGYYTKRCDECLDPVSLAVNVPITNRCDCEWVLVRPAAR